MACITACSSTRRATYKSDSPLVNLTMATDKSYGCPESNPIRVGGDEAVVLYLNMYDYEKPMYPVGLTVK